MLIAYILKSIRLFFQRKTVEAELSEMTDRALDDIGVRRSEISKVVRYGR